MQRIRLGITQEQLAEIMCIPKSNISAYENDKVDIKSSVIGELCKHLMTTPNYLRGYKKDRAVDMYAESIAVIVSALKDERTKALLLAQAQAAQKWEDRLCECVIPYCIHICTMCTKTICNYRHIVYDMQYKYLTLCE